MSARAPLIDPRDAAAISAQLRAAAPGYLPAWTALLQDQDGNGRALLDVLARYRAIFAEGLNHTPERTKLAFLETLGNALLPGQPARVPLVFDLLENSPQDVFLSARSQVAAKLPPPPTSVETEVEAGNATRTAPRYFTTRTVALSRAKLSALYSTDPRIDAFADHLASVRQGFAAFERFEAMRHEVYFGHDALFALGGNAEITLSIDMGGGNNADRRLMFDWEYLSTDGWLPLDVEEDTTQRFTRDGRVRLRKNGGPDAKKDKVMGRESFWLRARAAGVSPRARIVLDNLLSVAVDRAGALLAGDVVTIDGDRTARVVSADNRALQLDRRLPGLRPDAILRVLDATPALGAETEALLGPPTAVDLVMARVGFSKSGLKPDAAFADRAPLDLGNVFFPFGQQPVRYATFYLACEDAFSRRGAAIEIALKFSQFGAGSSALALAFEYYDGSQWRQLPTSLPVQLLDATDRFQLNGSVTFHAPGDWSATKVNGKNQHWLRVRIDKGDYGEPVKLDVVTGSGGTPVVSAVAPTLAPPAVEKLQISYTYFTNSQLLDHCVAYNNFVFRDHSEDVRWTRRLFEPLRHNADRDPSLNFGFDTKLPSGLVSLFLDAPGDAGADAASPFVWEYQSAEGWNELTVLDETAGLRRPGMIQFIGASDAVASEGMGGTLYRIRARLKPGELLSARKVSGLWLNAVWGMQGESVVRETIGRSDGNPDQVLSVPPQRVPVLAGEVVEVREWVGRGEDWRTAVDGVPDSALRLERDPVTAEPRAVWVRWEGREHLLESGPDDRHYALERTRGRLQFGDDRCGRIPPASASVALSFTTGIGEAGNVPAGTITELRTGVAYLQGVSNPVAADGGAAPEAIEDVVGRATFRLRHRGRAVASDDYAWMAHEASPAVARARCLPCHGEHGRTTPGAIGVVIVPRGSMRMPMPSSELRRIVRDFIADRCPQTVVRALSVLPPRYVQLDVVAHLVLADAGAATTVEVALRRSLDAWLHPTTGGQDGRGWPFGATVCLSTIAALVERTPGVDHAERIALRADGANAGDVVTLPADALPAAGFHEIKISLLVR